MQDTQREATRYTFQFTVFKVDARVRGDQKLVVQMGMKTVVVELSQIKYLYRRELKEQGMSELTIATENPKDRSKKLKRARLYADRGQAGFDDLWRYLTHLHPIANISHETFDVASERMGSQNKPWVAIPLVMSLGALLVIIVATPLLIHGIEKSKWSVDVASLYQDPASLLTPPSHQVELRGWVNLDQGVTPASTFTSSAPNQLSAPLYPEVSKEAEALPVALLIITARDRALAKLRANPSGTHQGILRSIAWEGLGDNTRKSLIKRGVLLTPMVYLVELGATSRDDLTLYCALIFMLTSVIILVWLYLKPAYLDL